MNDDNTAAQQQQEYVDPAVDIVIPIALPDIPDLSGITEERADPWDNAWYTGTFTDSYTATKDGLPVTFTSGDVVSNAGDSRNIRVRLTVRRKSDGRIMNTEYRVNYRPSDFTQESIAQVLAHKEAQKAAKAAGTDAPEWGPLFRTFSALTQLGTLQRIAGVRQFQRASDGSGGLDISLLFGKTCYLRLGDDDRKPQYKQVKEVSDVAPKKAQIL